MKKLFTGINPDFLQLNFLKLFFVALIAIIFLSSLAEAGTVHGVVKGEGKIIVGATVRLLEQDRTTHTNAKGEFTFLNVQNGAYTLFVRVIGFSAAEFHVSVADNTAETSFELHESAIPAEDIVISASPYARPADEQYQSAESKSMVELHESPGSSFAEKISDLPGVTVRSNGSAPSRPMLRGLSDNRVLILENGLRTGDISTYDPAHSVPIDALSIAQIDIVRGPASILYGPSTIGGLVNVITNTIPTASSTPFSGRVSLSGNTVSDEYSGFYNGVYSNGGSALSVFAGGLHSQDIKIPEGNYPDPANGNLLDLSRLPQSFDHTEEAGAGYSYQGDFGFVGIGYKHYEMNYGIPGVPPNPAFDPSTSRIAQDKNSVELRGLFPVDGAVVKQIKFNGNFVDYNHSEFPTAQDTITGAVSDPQANHFNKKAYNATLQFEHQLFGKFQGTVGVWTNIEDLAIEGDQPLGPNSTTTGLAGYLFEEYLANDDARLQLGLRYDYNKIQTRPFSASTDSVFQTSNVSQTSNALTFSVGAVQKLSHELTASLSVARSFRAPTVQELFANGSDAASGTYSIGDATLGPETGFGVDASLKGNFTDVSFELTPYVNIISDYIYAFLRGDTLMNFPVRQFAATDARLIGFEASVNVQPMRSFGLRVSVDYVDAEETKQNVPLPFTPPMRALLRGTYQNDQYSGMIEWRLAAAQNNLGDGDTYTAGYGVVNIGAGIRIVQDGMVHSISLHCDNLFNIAYRDNLSVIKDFVPQPGRGLRLSYDMIY